MYTLKLYHIWQEQANQEVYYQGKKTLRMGKRQQKDIIKLIAGAKAVNEDDISITYEIKDIPISDLTI